MSQSSFRDVKVGDTVKRMLGGEVPMELKVSELDDTFIHCGPWKFNRDYGYEVDEDLHWGVMQKDGTIHTGSFLVEP